MAQTIKKGIVGVSVGYFGNDYTVLMFRQVLLALLVFIILAALLLWVIGGGPRRAYENVTSIDFALPITPNEGVGFRLPWQPIELFPTIDITGAVNEMEEKKTPEEELASLVEEYDRLERSSHTLQFLGKPSPYAGKVYIGKNSYIRAESAAQEYVDIVASGDSESVMIAGWSLESALSGVRVYLPPAASPFRMGTTNTFIPTTLSKNESARIFSAPSPVGVSFKENMCTGYLNQFQNFDPLLPERCPAPSSVLPLTEQNLVRYGDECFSLIQTLQNCRFPQDIPHTVTAACRTFLSDTLSYNGCVRDNSFRPEFNGSTWYLFIGSSRELWRNSHDAIRLLDTEGRTVDVFTY